MTHPENVCGWLDVERSTSKTNDGFWSRFQFVIPRPIIYKSYERPLVNAGIPSFAGLMHAIAFAHPTEINEVDLANLVVYSLEEDSRPILNAVVDEEWIQYIKHSSDNYMGGMYFNV